MINLEKDYTLAELHVQMERMKTVEGRHKTWQRIKAKEREEEQRRVNA